MAKEKVGIGLDIEKRHVSMVKLVAEPQGKIKLVDFTSVPLEPDADPNDRVRLLEKLVRNKELAGQLVNIGISGESVVVRYIDLPKMKESEILQALRYEAQQYIPFKMEEVIFDFNVLDAQSAGSRMKVLLVAAKKQAILDYVNFLKPADIKLNLVDINSFSLMNCFEKLGPVVKDDDIFALVNLECDLVNINILQGRTPFFTRDISLEEGVVTLAVDTDEELLKAFKPIIPNLIREVKISIDYFESEFEKHVSCVYISGEGVRLQELVQSFNEKLGREIVQWDVIEKLHIDSTKVKEDAIKKASPMLVLACGLALRGI